MVDASKINMTHDELKALFDQGREEGRIEAQADACGVSVDEVKAALTVYRSIRRLLSSFDNQ